MPAGYPLNSIEYIPNLFSNSFPEIYAQNKPGNLFVLPKSHIENRFLEVAQAVNQRWEKLANEIDFPKYRFKADVQSLKEEYKDINGLRKNLHVDFNNVPYRSNSDFTFAQDLIAHHRYRQPNCISFEHSKTDSSYNSTCLLIDNRKFFALEGPTENTLEYFYNLLVNWNVNSLVSLTGESENGIPKCYPYWEGHTFEKEGNTFLKVPIEGQYETPQSDRDMKKISYMHIPHWADHHGFNEQDLINAANKMRSNTSPDEIMAVHCSAGVGRTGTFIATVALLDEIDKQLEKGVQPEDVEINISKLFLKMNFFRRPLVAKEPQYITLYRVVDIYLQQKIDEKKVLKSSKSFSKALL